MIFLLVDAGAAVGADPVHRRVERGGAPPLAASWAASACSRRSSPRSASSSSWRAGSAARGERDERSARRLVAGAGGGRGLRAAGAAPARLRVDRDPRRALVILMLFAGGARTAHVARPGACSGRCCSPPAPLAAPYRMRRLLSFLDPWGNSQEGAFQLVQSLIAFGSGGLAGVGLGQQPAEDVLPARGAHRFHLRADRRGARACSARWRCWPCSLMIAVRGYRIAARHPDAFGSLAGLRPHVSDSLERGGQRGGGARPAADQGLSASVLELRRLRAAELDVAGGDARGACRG